LLEMVDQEATAALLEPAASERAQPPEPLEQPEQALLPDPLP
jgi:hypothetical protein